MTTQPEANLFESSVCLFCLQSPFCLPQWLYWQYFRRACKMSDRVSMYLYLWQVFFFGNYQVATRMERKISNHSTQLNAPTCPRPRELIKAQTLACKRLSSSGCHCWPNVMRFKTSVGRFDSWLLALATPTPFQMPLAN